MERAEATLSFTERAHGVDISEAGTSDPAIWARRGRKCEYLDWSIEADQTSKIDDGMYAAYPKDRMAILRRGIRAPSFARSKT